MRIHEGHEMPKMRLRLKPEALVLTSQLPDKEMVT
jgi:hypothetical protein